MFEGLPVVALEVQANGLATIASKEAMPQKIKVLDNFDFYSLNRTPEEWAEKILTMDRKRSNEEVIKSSFEIAGFEWIMVADDDAFPRKETITKIKKELLN